MKNRISQRCWDGKTRMAWVYDNGGRTAEGYKGETRDCVARAIAIAAQIPYQVVYDALNGMAARERPRKGRRSSARTGVAKPTCRRYLESLGWTWHPTMQIGSGCKVHLCEEELPPGRLIVSASRHMTAVIDHVIHDTHDPQRDTLTTENGETRIMRRCVYGYFSQDKNDVISRLHRAHDWPRWSVEPSGVACSNSTHRTTHCHHFSADSN